MASPPPCTNLLDCALYWERAAADRICFTQPMGGGDANLRTWTWSQAVDEARRVAAYLKGLDLPPRSSIALCSKNCAYWLMADLAIWMAGHISVPIYPILTADIVNYTLEHSEARLLFVGKLDPVWEEMKKGVPEDMKTVTFPLAPENGHEQWEAIVAAHSPLEDVAECPPDETATIIYTSGSTGKPKGAMLSFEAMYRSGKGLSEYLETTPEDRALSYLPLAHAMERFVGQSLSLASGYQLFFAESLDTFVQDLQRARPTLFASVPRLWLKFQLGVFEKVPPAKLDRLLKIPILSGMVKKKILRQLGLDQVRVAASGSAPIPKEVIAWYRRLGLELMEGYGMTENFSYSHIGRPGRIRPGYVGNPYPDVEHRLSPEGEILVKSPGTMKGYFKMPEENEHIFTEDGFFHTGDLGEIDEMGRLKITGRAKELFKTSKGKYVAPAPIENQLASSHLVEACYVTGSGYHQAHAVVMLSEEARQRANGEARDILANELAALLADVNRGLPPFERLAFLAVARDDWTVENGFLTPTMKIKRRVLDATYGPLAETWYGMNAPVVWQEAV
ncbi:AMP-binding protein [uncultured Desulfosarcina sp.]|uniref:AMP-binding protein n=1 Tax=uncultured Desulfosarcina sp. TaxID=218289 RepID=UPI0029C68624|nr:AMP-binding protein [uncultured Desulfosarcina sp.]